MNGPHCLDLCESFGVSRFPTLLLLTGKENVDELDPHDKRRVLPFPRGVPRTTENILHFLRTGAPLQQGQGKEAAAAAGEGHGTCAMPPSNAISGRAQRCEASDAAKGSSRSSDSDDETDEGTTGVEALRSWRETLLRAGIDLVENLEVGAIAGGEGRAGACKSTLFLSFRPHPSHFFSFPFPELLFKGCQAASLGSAAAAHTPALVIHQKQDTDTLYFLHGRRHCIW